MARGFYDENGLKRLEINTDDHGNPKMHPYGEKGEHIHHYAWNEEGTLRKKTVRELTENERKENRDIL